MKLNKSLMKNLYDIFNIKSQKLLSVKNKSNLLHKCFLLMPIYVTYVVKLYFLHDLSISKVFNISKLNDFRKYRQVEEISNREKQQLYIFQVYISISFMYQ